MTNFDSNKNILQIEIKTKGLDSTQIRLIKSLNTLLGHVLTTTEESEYFDSSAELMRMCASLIKQSNFTQNDQENGIPYAEQALEFSMDRVYDQICHQKIIIFDN